MGKLKNFGKSYLKFVTFGLVDIDKKSKKPKRKPFYKPKTWQWGLLVLIILSFFIGGNSEAPSEQKSFHKKRTPTNKVENWYGKIKKKGFFEVLNNNEKIVYWKDIEYRLSPYDKLNDSEYKKFNSLTIGDKVLFSGIFEYWSSSQIEVICTKLTNTDESITYYEKSIVEDTFVESQISFLKELDRRIVDYKKRKRSLHKKVLGEKNKFKNPGVNWNEYHDFLYEQLKWLTNTSYNEFYKSNIDGWTAKITNVSSFEGQYKIECNIGIYGMSSKKTIGFGLLTYSRGVVNNLSVGSWVKFNGSWNTDWDSKPISGSYDKTVTNYIDGVEMPTMFGGFNRTEKDIGKLSGDHSNDSKKPKQTFYAEALLNSLYKSDTQYDDPDITFFIDISSVTAIDD